MVSQTSVFSGASLFQEGLPISNFLCSDNDGLIFVPSNSDPSELVTTQAFVTHQPDDPNSIWAGVDIDWSRITSDASSLLHALFTLYGITPQGDIVQVGEKVITSCPTSLLRETITFNTLQSACEPALTINPAAAAAGKINLNLPMTYKNFDDCELYPLFPDPLNFPKMRTIPVTGSIDGIQSSFPVGPITIPYDSDMKTDFSDIRLFTFNGSSFVSVPFEFIRVVNGVSATVFVQLTSLPGSPAVTGLFMEYGNSSATSLSSNLSHLLVYDDFEDNKLTGRTAPYVNWTGRGGTGALISSGQISGAYSYKHTGSGIAADSNCGTFPNTNDTTTIRFNFKLTTQGAGSQTPYVFLFYLRYLDNLHYVRLDTYYNGTNQMLRLSKYESGVFTTIKEVAWLTGKLGGSLYTFTIFHSPTFANVYVNGVLIVGSSYTTTTAQTNSGVGCNVDSAGVWDDILIRGYMSSSAYLYHEPTVGAVSSEFTNSGILPDVTGDDFTQLAFSKPSYWIDGNPGYFTTRKPANYNVPTSSLPMAATHTFQLGYDGMDKFDALRLGIFVTANANYNFNINQVTFRTA
jgi:hypothetical protein